MFYRDHKLYDIYIIHIKILSQIPVEPAMKKFRVTLTPEHANFLGTVHNALVAKVYTVHSFLGPMDLFHPRICYGVIIRGPIKATQQLTKSYHIRNLKPMLAMVLRIPL